MEYRHYRDGIRLSILGFGGMVLVGLPEQRAGRIVAESVDRGVNYFDVAPFYGDGKAEEKLGPSLRPYRNKVFLACKTLDRTASGARRELERSLRRLGTDHVDLYQFHSVSRMEDVERILSPGGAAELFLRAREQGKVRYLGFSAHSVGAALAMLRRFEFDSVLFPVNFVCYARGNFGPQIVRAAREKGIACLALKSMAETAWRKGEERRYPNCWYRPVEGKERALAALRFTLSEAVTAAVPPGDERLFRLALDLAPRITPLDSAERERLLESARGLKPIMSAGRALR